jgi:hypothetical protein
MHFLHSNLDSFLVNCGAASDEYGEGFHLDISAKKNRYKGKWSAAISTYYCYMVKRDTLGIQSSDKRKGASLNSFKLTVVSCFHTAI